MFNLEKLERCIIIGLVICALIGLAITELRRREESHGVSIKKFSLKTEPKKEADSGSGELININYAASSDLMKLKGVGKVLADRIVDHRSSQGFFLYKESLKEVKGIGGALFDRIKDRVAV